MTNVDDEWERFMMSQNGIGTETSEEIFSSGASAAKSSSETTDGIPTENTDAIAECEELYISTKTKVLFLNHPIPIQTIFWKLPVIKYSSQSDGIIKKQMKIVSNTPEEFEQYMENIKNIEYYVENIVKQVNNPTARRLKYKDERKITIGMSKKDIMNCRGKTKNAFYNCFAIILRFWFNNEYKEIHVKIFNTGKLEIPGILNDAILEKVSTMILDMLRPYMSDQLQYNDMDTEANVLINSNFNCGYYLNRDKLYAILRQKYKIETSYEPCSYPGIKCKFYYNNEQPMTKETQSGLVYVGDRDQTMTELNDNNKYTEVSFMVFRTGSCLIVGNCKETTLRFVYSFIRDMFENERPNIYVPNNNTEVREKKKKIRKKTVIFTPEYYKRIYELAGIS